MDISFFGNVMLYWHFRIDTPLLPTKPSSPSSFSIIPFFITHCGIGCDISPRFKAVMRKIFVLTFVNVYARLCYERMKATLLIYLSLYEHLTV